MKILRPISLIWRNLVLIFSHKLLACIKRYCLRTHVSLSSGEPYFSQRSNIPSLLTFIIIFFSMLISLYYYLSDTVKLGDIGSILAGTASSVAFIWLYVSIKTQFDELNEQNKMRRLAIAQAHIELTKETLNYLSNEVLLCVGRDLPKREAFDLSESLYVLVDLDEEWDTIRRATRGLQTSSLNIFVNEYVNVFQESIVFLQSIDNDGYICKPFEKSVYGKVHSMMKS